MKITAVFILFAISLTLTSCVKTNTHITQNQTASVKKNPIVKLSFALTNDIHGRISPNLTYLSSALDMIRKEPEYQSGSAALFVLDSGDQFQGTLESNYDEGETVFKVMNEIQYDAVVPGNHDYDFGPLGWLYDKVTPGKTFNDPREVIKSLSALAKFPLLSANTYYKNSIKAQGLPVSLDDECRPINQTLAEPLNFVDARRPEFLKPYVILDKNNTGVRVALIGLDHHSTSTTTTKENVADLCFRDEVQAYLDVRRELEGLADVFVLLIHNGNTDKSKEASAITQSINEAYPDGVHLVAAGHTHTIHDTVVKGIRILQNGSGGKHFGRVDLYYNKETKSVLNENTQSAAGIAIPSVSCGTEQQKFACEQITLPVPSNKNIDRLIDNIRSLTDLFAKRKLGVANGTLKSNRINENALGNALTNLLKKRADADVALMNTGGIRTSLNAGEFLYENVFEILPFQNQAVLINSMPWSILKSALTTAAKTCGLYGTLVQSGLKIEFVRDCSKNTDTDPDARLIKVETLYGETLLNTETGVETDSNRSFKVVTLDFLAAGGSGYSVLKEANVDETLGIARELIIEQMIKDQPVLQDKIDFRFKNKKGGGPQ